MVVINLDYLEIYQCFVDHFVHFHVSQFPSSLQLDFIILGQYKHYQIIASI